jgi:hypothetical protein
LANLPRNARGRKRDKAANDELSHSGSVFTERSDGHSCVYSIGAWPRSFLILTEALHWREGGCVP